MKILKNGDIERIKPYWLKQVWHCISCGCEWMAEEGDTIEPGTTTDVRGETYSSGMVMNCPTCGKRVDMPTPTQWGYK